MNFRLSVNKEIGIFPSPANFPTRILLPSAPAWLAGWEGFASVPSLLRWKPEISLERGGQAPDRARKTRRGFRRVLSA